MILNFSFFIARENQANRQSYAFFEVIKCHREKRKRIIMRFGYGCEQRKVFWNSIKFQLKCGGGGIRTKDRYKTIIKTLQMIPVHLLRHSRKLSVYSPIIAFNCYKLYDLYVAKYEEGDTGILIRSCDTDFSSSELCEC